MDCQLITTDGRVFVCEKCGRKHTLSRHERLPLHLQCGRDDAAASAHTKRNGGLRHRVSIGRTKTATERLGITFADAVHYGMALAKWSVAGFSERSDEEVEAILPICLACERHVAGRCIECRCRVNSGPAVTNKIRMATEKCPLGKWPKTGH